MALSYGVGIEEFENLTPKDIHILGKAAKITEKRNHVNMLMQASYVREAMINVVAGAFGKHLKWRTRTYIDDRDEQNNESTETERIEGMRIMKNLELSMAVFNLNKANEKLAKESE